MINADSVQFSCTIYQNIGCNHKHYLFWMEFKLICCKKNSSSKELNLNKNSINQSQEKIYEMRNLVERSRYAY